MWARLVPVNQHSVERGIRVALGLALLALAFTGPRTAWGLAGVVPLLTGMLGSCPIYTLLGISTCPLTATRKTT